MFIRDGQPKTSPVFGERIPSRFSMPNGHELVGIYKHQKANGQHPLRALVRTFDRDHHDVTTTAQAVPGKALSFGRSAGTAVAAHKELAPLSGPAGNMLALAARGVGRVTQGNQTQLYVDGRTAYPALQKLIADAKQTLYIETMSWRNDTSGRQIAKDVVAAHKRGVDVKIMVDSFGLYGSSTKTEDMELMEWMRSQGVNVQVFNPSIVTKQGIALNHHKLYIADNERYLSGGMNVGDAYAQEWHDMLFEVAGPAARSVAREFAVDWQRTTGDKLTIPEPKHPTPVPGTAAVGIAVTDPIGKRFEMKSVNLTMINEAKHHIQIAMPYCSDDDLMNALRAAARRGVTVDMIMPSINDISSYVTLNPAEAEDLVKDGVNVRFYSGGTVDGKELHRFSHLKMMIIDETVAAVGSGNADFRTYRKNNELNSYIADPTFVKTLQTDVFDKDWRESRQTTLSELQQRPLKDRVVGNLNRLFDRFM